MNEKWIENLRTQKRRLKRLRKEPKIDIVNGLPWVSIKRLAEQFYCEQKVDLELKIGKRFVKDLYEGSKVHRKADLHLTKVGLKRLIEDIVSKKPLIAKFAVDFEFGGIPIFGVPDQIFFRDSKPFYLFELKSSSQELERVYKGEKVQALLYCYGLEKMGFDCSNLLLAIVKVKRELETDKYSKLIKEAVKELYLIQKSKNVSSGHRKIEAGYIHWWEYRGISEFEEELRDKLNYWIKKRSPRPSQNRNKCERCAYKNECSKA